MIKAFISQAAQGKSISLILEAASQENKKVAFISFEMSANFILKRLESIQNKTHSFVIYVPNTKERLNTWLYKRIEKLSEEFDLICIDGVEVVPNLDLKKLNDVCFGNFMNQCTELWISKQTYNKSFVENYLLDIKKVKEFEEKNLLTIKQVCRKIDNTLIKNASFIEAVDLEKNEIKTYNLSNLFKN